MKYRIDFACDDRELLQQKLNELYEYGDDIGTKVLHRCRLNLLSLLLRERVAREAIPSFDSALDIGCNAGMYCNVLSEHGFRYVLGIDVVDAMIRKANTAFGCRSPDRVVEFKLQDAESLDTERTFDFVLCTEVIEHTRDPSRVIANIKAILSPGGLAIISLPNRTSLPYLLSWLAHSLGLKPKDEVFERHLDYPFYRSIRLFRGDGMDVVATDGTNLFWNGRTLKWLYGTRLFPTLNRMNFHLSRLWPLKYAAQSFYLTVRHK